jgi:LacI family transcriptional regulator
MSLNNTGSVSEETRERVNKNIRSTLHHEQGSQKSAHHHSNTIGVLVVDITVWNAPQIIKGIGEYFESINKHLILTDLGLLSKIGSIFLQSAV